MAFNGIFFYIFILFTILLLHTSSPTHSLSIPPSQAFLALTNSQFRLLLSTTTPNSPPTNTQTYSGQTYSITPPFTTPISSTTNPIKSICLLLPQIETGGALAFKTWVQQPPSSRILYPTFTPLPPPPPTVPISDTDVVLYTGYQPKLVEPQILNATIDGRGVFDPNEVRRDHGREGRIDGHKG